MLSCEVPEGDLYYGETRRREKVQLTEELREKVKAFLKEMHELYHRGYTPTVKQSKNCKACSLYDCCLPVIVEKRSVQDYLQQTMAEE